MLYQEIGFRSKIWLNDRLSATKIFNEVTDTVMYLIKKGRN